MLYSRACMCERESEISSQRILKILFQSYIWVRCTLSLNVACATIRETAQEDRRKRGYHTQELHTLQKQHLISDIKKSFLFKSFLKYTSLINESKYMTTSIACYLTKLPGRVQCMRWVGCGGGGGIGGVTWTPGPGDVIMCMCLYLLSNERTVGFRRSGLQERGRLRMISLIRYKSPVISFTIFYWMV
eukprot:sb/3471250/